MLKGKKIILGITGGIAAYKSCEITRRLKKLGAEVIVIMTKAATKFVTPLTFETLSGNEVVTQLFPKQKVVGTRHITLAKWPDLILIAPATANLIGKIKSGIADDILTTVITSTRTQVLIAPAMNVQMYENHIVQENIRCLINLGYKFIGPEAGDLACGDEGKGRMSEPETIVQEVVNLLTKKKDFAGKKILVTAGRTEEPLDSVRYLSNRSSGKMGYAIAEEAKKRGAEVTLISGPTNLFPPHEVSFIPAKTAQDMYSAVNSHFKNAGILIMSAAVSDFTPEKVERSKIKKSEKGMTLKLKPTPDILKQMGKNKKDKILVGFSLETENEIENAKRKMKEKNLDLIVVNNPNLPGAGFEVDTNLVTLIDKKGKIEKLELLPKRKVAEKILDKIKTFL